jgi:hypothetical protein
MIIDYGNYDNISSTTLVRKLSINIVKHHKPYILQWLNEYDDVKYKASLGIVFYLKVFYWNVVWCGSYACKLLIIGPSMTIQ